MGKVADAVKAANATRIWAGLKQMYGTKFIDQFGLNPSDEWIVGTETLNAAQVRDALRKVRDSASQWPPSLPEFLAYARSVDLRPLQSSARPDADKFTQYVDKFLWSYLCTKGAASPASLRKLINAKQYWAGVYREICKDEPAASTELRGKLMAAMDAVWEPMSTEDMLYVAEQFKTAGHAVALPMPRAAAVTDLARQALGGE